MKYDNCKNKCNVCKQPYVDKLVKRKEIYKWPSIFKFNISIAQLNSKYSEIIHTLKYDVLGRFSSIVASKLTKTSKQVKAPMNLKNDIIVT